MPTLEEFVLQMAAEVESITIADLIMNGSVQLEAGICKRLSFERRAEQLLAVLGKEAAESFFAGCEPQNMGATQHLLMFLIKLVLRAKSVSPGPLERLRIELDQESVFAELRHLARAVADGAMGYTLALRLTNVDVDEPFDLASGIRFHKLTPEELAAKYPPDNQFWSMPQMAAEAWRSHCVEVVFAKTGTPAEFQKEMWLGLGDEQVNAIVHSFLLAGVAKEFPPHVTDMSCESVIESARLLRSIGGFAATPYRLTAQDIERLRRAHVLLAGTHDDLLLHKAIDRFLLGMKRSDSHPNRRNEPLWDKIVDYTIGLETLLLSTNGKAADGELSYRFRLNGAAMLSRCGTGHSPKELFGAMKALYDMRSKVVHASDDSEVDKAARKFLAELGVDPGLKRGGFFRSVLEMVEDWSRRLFFHVSQTPVGGRPYRKTNGWEELLWDLPAGEWSKKPAVETP